MLDFNHRPKFHEQVSALIDRAQTDERAKEARRDYLGASRLGVACDRALQFEYVQAPVDSGRDFSGRLLRVFEVGHALEALAIRWLRLAGFALQTRQSNEDQLGFSTASGRIRGHIDGVITNVPAVLNLVTPMLWECKTMADKHWRTTVRQGVAVAKPIYAAQIATYQAYMEPQIPGISANPALFTAINKDTEEIWFELLPFDAPLAQRMSDRAVKIVLATEAGELLPRTFNTPSHFECRFCPWQNRCWRALQ